MQKRRRSSFLTNLVISQQNKDAYRLATTPFYGRREIDQNVFLYKPIILYIKAIYLSL
ncbi:hypothetical protein SAMN05661044_04349 [Olivibacter domesticus]|uniref:Uncharacterized protein n=1 Tax=Olivibacter domesticus TaxID=407022 RepID=A0A1H7VTU2_OLID1|nr:hypothetical protein SAMN05661044_04349 [Olivibacter domesticus]